MGGTNQLQGRFLTPGETIDYLIKNRKSFIRWGDGETRILRGYSIYFQEPNPMLQKCMSKILDDYKQEKTNFLLGLPNAFLQMSDVRLKELKLYKIWRKTRRLFYSYCHEGQTYGDAFAFRPDPEVQTASNEEISRLWKDAEDIILVHSNKQYFIDFNNSLKKRLYFIQIPENNAFQQYDSIFHQVLEIIKNQRLPKETLKILVSAGPAAKVLVYDLSTLDYIAYDMGHYFDSTFYGKGIEGITREWELRKRNENKKKA